MKPMLSSMSLAVAALLATALPGYAAGPYDGTWVADAPAAGGVGAGTEVPTGCQAVRLPFKVTNNRISGNLARSTYGTGRVQAGPGGTPITGTVQPDGTFNAQWQNYHATGKLAGNKVEVHWNGECGPRVATGTRIAAAGESTGATMPPAAAANPAAPFDGTWVFDAPAAGGTGQSTGLSGCEALRLPLKIVNNQVVGSLERSRYGTARVQPGEGPRAEAVTGSVKPDGTLTAQWEGYRATGKLSGNTAQLQWRGQCGQRVATGTRMVAAGEGAGATMPPAAMNPSAPFDGEWVVDAPARGGTGQSVRTGCEALRLPFKIVNNQIVGSLQRSTYGTGRVQPGEGGRATPVTGTVSPDGTINAQWQDIRVTGKLSGNNAQLQWRGQCGQRTATGTRMVAAGSSTSGSH